MRIAASQRETLNPVMVELNFATHQSMHPMRVDRDRAAEQADLAVVVSTPQVDEAAGQRTIEVQLPAFRERPARGCLLASHSVPRAMGMDVSRGMAHQLWQVGKGEALPHLGLPEGVEALDGVLQAMFERWREDGRHAQCETKAADPPDGIGKLVCPLEAGVVVELSVGRQTQLGPALDQAMHHHGSAQLDLRPSTDLMAVDGNAGEHAQPRPAMQSQIFDQVETVQLGGAAGEIGEIPAWRRRRSALPSRAVLGAMALEHAVNGRQRRYRNASGTELGVNGLRAALAEHTVVAQTLPQLQDRPFPFSGCGGAVPWRSWPTWLIAEVHPIQATTAGARDPFRYHRGTDGKAPCNGTYPLPTPYRRDHHSTLPFIIFLDTTSSEQKRTRLPACSRIAETRVFMNC